MIVDNEGRAKQPNGRSLISPQKVANAVFPSIRPWVDGADGPASIKQVYGRIRCGSRKKTHFLAKKLLFEPGDLLRLQALASLYDHG